MTAPLYPTQRGRSQRLSRARVSSICLWAALAQVAPLALSWAQLVRPAEIALRRTDGAPLTTVGLGERLDLEVVIDAGTAELTGFALFLSFDSRVFQVAPPPPLTGQVSEPFLSGDLLDGVVLLNRTETVNGDTYLAYAEAAGVQRRTATGAGVAARFSLKAVRRPLGDLTTIAVEERGHDRASHYTTADRPGTEHAFGRPLGTAQVRVTGFQIQPLPAIVVVEGDGEQTVYPDLGAFVDQEGAQVIWSASFVGGLNTEIDPQDRVTMRPEGVVGDTTVLFTAFEVGEGNEDAETVPVHILSRPRVTGLAPTVTFDEDGASDTLDLDAFVTDLDDSGDDLSWTATNGTFVHVDIDTVTHRAVFAADPNAYGTGEIRLVVRDPGGLADTVTTTAVVNPVNDPPRVARLKPVYPRLGATGAVVVPLADLLQDADDAADSLQLALQTEGDISAQLTPDGKGLEVTGTATGRGVIRVTARDREGVVATGRLVAVVLPEGRTLAPQIAPLPELRFAAGLPGTLDLNQRVSDDSPISTLNWTPASIDALRPVVRDGILLVSAASGFTGPAAVGLIVTDPDGNQDSASLAVQVLPAGQQQPPRIFPPAKVGLAGGQVTLPLDPLVEDPDGSAESVTWKVTPSQGITADYDPTSRTVRLSAPPGRREVGTLTLTATDRDGHADTRSIPVLAVEPEGAPLIGPLQPVALDSADAVGRLDLDDVVFDDEDFESEIAWTAVGEPGLVVDLDPVTHLLRLRRQDGARDPLPPAEVRVVLTARDTRGQERSAILAVALPPLFRLDPIPGIALFAGGADTSLVLSDYVAGADPATVRWSVSPPTNLSATIDSATTRVRVSSPDPSFVGSEILRFTAADTTGRSRPATARVTVRGPGLAPQIRSFPVIAVRAGETDRSVDLDDFVVDDDPDSALAWSVSRPADVQLSVDALSHELTVRPADTAIGQRTAQVLVADPAGNTALGLIEIQVLRGGDAPVISGLPQLLLPAGGPEQALSLDLFVDDPDTPDDRLTWMAGAEPGVGARVDGRRLLLSVPVGQRGTRRVRLTAIDPQGNQAEATVTILIPEDDEPPSFALEVRRNPVANDLLDIAIRPSEALDGAPEVRLNGAIAELTAGPDSTWLVSFQVPPVDEDQAVTVEVAGLDRAGNLGQRRADVALRRVAHRGGTLPAPNGKATLNLPGAVAGPGRLAVLYPLSAEDLPEGAASGPGEAFFLDVAAGATLDTPAVLSLFAGAMAADQRNGIQHWNPAARRWEDVPTIADEDSGWLSAAVREPGLYRLGPVAADSRRPATSLSNYPNPFNAVSGAATRIEYEVTVAGPVQVHVFNTLGQRVRLLVDEAFQEVGVWTVDWDGRDADGRRLASGVYLYQLTEPGATRLRPLLLLR